MNHQKEKLYRKVNTRTRMGNERYYCSVKGPDSKNERNTKIGMTKKMTSKDHGLDYTPLFRFLISKIGKPWETAYKEAQSRLDSEEQIFWMINNDAIHEVDPRDYFMYHNSYYPRLVIDNNGILHMMNPDLKNEDFYPHCSCCTHSYNGVPLVNKATDGKYGRVSTTV